MFIVLLKFSDIRAKTGEAMDGHNAWLARGFDDGVWVLAGSLAGGEGGAIVAHGETRAALERRVAEDPCVAEGVVRAEVVESAPGRVAERLGFLLD